MKKSPFHDAPKSIQEAFEKAFAGRKDFSNGRPSSNQINEVFEVEGSFNLRMSFNKIGLGKNPDDVIIELNTKEQKEDALNYVSKLRSGCCGGFDSHPVDEGIAEESLDPLFIAQP